MKPMQSIKPKLYVTPRVQQKMKMLVAQCDKEVAWHGYVERSQKTPNAYIWFDIILYPQYVTGATVNPDEKEYADWLDEQYKFSEEKYNKMRLHGHSHVNMSPTPSVVDMSFRKDIIANLQDGDFYFFLIINKSDQFTLELYDNASKIVFDQNDIEYIVSDEEEAARTLEWVSKVLENCVKENKRCSTTSRASTSSTPRSYTKQEKKSTSLGAERWEDPWPRYYYGLD